MSLATADYITKWVPDSSGDYTTEIITSGLQLKYGDITGQDYLTNPNCFVAKVTADESVLDALDALPNTSELPGTRELIEDEEEAP